MTDMSTLAGQAAHYAEVRARLMNPPPRIASTTAPITPSPVYGYAPITLTGSPSWEKIVELVALRFSFTPHELLGSSQFREITAARHYAMYLVYTHCQPLSLEGLGKLFNRAVNVADYAVRKHRAPSEVVRPPALKWKGIKAEVARKHGITLKEMASPQRKRNIVLARQEAFYRLKTETAMSFPEIGRRMGGLDHTTVLYGYRRHAALLAKVGA